MKKSLCIVFCCCLLIAAILGSYALGRCASSDKAEEETMTACPEGLINPSVVSCDPHYMVLEDENRNSYYYIYDDEGRVVDEGSTTRMTPVVSFENDEVICVHQSVGSGIWWSKYYSLKRDVVSQKYDYVFAFNGELVVYIDIPSGGSAFETRRLVIRNAFDKAEFYMAVDLELAEVHSPIIRAEFINNNTQLEVTYYFGEDIADMQEITEIIDLAQADD